MLIALVLIPLVLVSTGADSSGADKTISIVRCNHNFLRAQELAPAEKNSTDLSAMSAAFFAISASNDISSCGGMSKVKQKEMAKLSSLQTEI